MQSLIFFNKEGDNLNFRWNETDKMWEGDLIFHENSDDTFKTIGLYVLEKIPAFDFRKRGATISLDKFQLFNEHGINFYGSSFSNESIISYEQPNNDPKLKSKWIYGVDFDKKFPVGSQVKFSGTLGDFSELKTYNVHKTKKGAILLLGDTTNNISPVPAPETIPNFKLSGVNSIGVYDYSVLSGIPPVPTDNLSSWSEPQFYRKYFTDRKLNIINSEKNDSVVTVKSTLLPDREYKRFILNPSSLIADQTFLLRLTLKTDLPTIFTGTIQFVSTSKELRFAPNEVPQSLKPGIRFTVPQATQLINQNFLTVDNIQIYNQITTKRDIPLRYLTIYENIIYECKKQFIWTATASIFPNNVEYWKKATYIPIVENIANETIAAEIQLSTNIFDYTQSYTQSNAYTYGSSIARYSPELRDLNVDYYYKRNFIYCDLLYPEDYANIEFYSGTTKLITENVDIKESNIEIEEPLKTELNKNFSETISYDIWFTDIDEFGIEITINGQIYYEDVEFSYDGSDVNMDSTINQTLKNWLTKWYVHLANLGIIAQLGFTGKEYSDYYNSISFETEYPNVPFIFSVRVGTTANYYIPHTKLLLFSLSSYFTLQINGVSYPQTVTINNGVVDFETTLNNWVDTWSQKLDGFDIHVVNSLSMLEFFVKEQDQRFDLVVNTGILSIPGKPSYEIMKNFTGNLGCLITSNSVTLPSDGTFSFENEKFATGQLISVNNSSRPYNNTEYNVLFLGSYSMNLSYQGPFWSTKDPYCDIAPFSTLAFSTGFNVNNCLPVAPRPALPSEFAKLEFTDSFQIQFGASNSYTMSYIESSDFDRFADIKYLNTSKRIYVLTGTISNTLDGRLVVYNSRNNDYVDNVVLPNMEVARSITFNPVNNYLYLLTSKKTFVVDPYLPRLEYSFSLSENAEKLEVNPINGDVWITYGTYSNKFQSWAVDNFTTTPTKEFDIPSLQFFEMAFNVDEQDMYVTTIDNLNRGFILRIDGDTRIISKSFSVANLKKEIFYGPWNSSIYAFGGSRGIVNINGGELTDFASVSLSSWLPLSSGLTSSINGIHVAGQNGMGVGDFGRITRTLNGGQSWASANITGMTTRLRSVYVVGANFWAVGDSGRLIRGTITNTPGTWTNTTIPSAVSTSLTNVRFITTSTGYAVGGTLFLKSTDGGVNWSFTTLAGSSQLNSVWADPTGNTGYVVGNSGFIAKSSNLVGAYTFTSQTDNKPPMNVVFSSNTAGTNYTWVAGASGSLLRTTNTVSPTTNGFFLMNTGTNSNINGLYFTNSTSGFLVGDRGLIMRTTNSGSNWSRIISPVTNNLNSVFFGLSGFGWIVGDGGAILKATDGTGASWQNISFGTTNLRSVHFWNNDEGVIVGDSGTIYKTTNSGINWSTVASGTTDNLNFITFVSDPVSGFGASYGVIVGQNGRILRSVQDSTDKNIGNVWSTIGGGSGNLTSINFVDTLNGWVSGQSGQTFKSVNSGKAWSASGAAGSQNLRSIYFYSTTVGHAVSPIDGSIWRTVNGGNNWTRLEFNLNSVHFFDTNVGWAAGQNGIILRTRNGGTNWNYLSSGQTNEILQISFLNDLFGYMVGRGGLLRKTLDGGLTWINEDTGNTNNAISLIATDVAFVGGTPSSILLGLKKDPKFVRNISYDTAQEQVNLSSPGNFNVLNLDGVSVSQRASSEYGPLLYNPFDGDTYIGSQFNLAVAVMDKFTNRQKQSIRIVGPPTKLIYNPDRKTVYGIIPIPAPEETDQLSKLFEIKTSISTNLVTSITPTFSVVDEFRYGSLAPGYVPPTTIWLKAREYARKPRINYNDEPFADLIATWETDEIKDIFMYDFSGDQLSTTASVPYTGPKPLPLVSLNTKENTKPDRAGLSEFQKTIFGTLKFTLDHIDSETNFKIKPKPIQIFIGANSKNEGVINSTLLLNKRENIDFTITTNSTNSNIIEFTTETDSDGVEFGYIILNNNSQQNFRQDGTGITRGLKPGQHLKITVTDATNTKNKYISVNSGIIVEIEEVSFKYLRVNYIERTFSDEFTQVDDYPTVNKTTFLRTRFQIIDRTIAKFNVKVQTEIEDIRYKIELGNNGQLINPDDIFIYKTYDINEQGIDWTFLNKKRKELLMVRNDIFPYVGSYKAIINAINYFGYNDLELYEYYRNIDTTDPKYDTLFKVEIPDIFDNTIKGWNEKDFLKYTLPNPRYEETNLFNLTFRITDREGTNILLYSLAEVLMKLQGLKFWLESKVIPITHRILDITGRADFSGANVIQHRNYDTTILNVKQDFTPVDFKLTEAYLSPVNSGSTVYTCRIDFFIGSVPTYSSVPDYFKVKIRTYKTYKEWNPTITYDRNDIVSYYGYFYTNVLDKNKLKNPRKYENVQTWTGSVDYILGQYVNYNREIYQYIGLTSSSKIFGSSSTVNPFVDISRNSATASWFNMTEWKVTDFPPVQTLSEIRTVGTVSSIHDMKPLLYNEQPPPQKVSHPYMFTIDSNLDPFVVIELTSDNGYGQTYTFKKNYEIRSTKDLQDPVRYPDTIGPYVPVVQLSNII